MRASARPETMNRGTLRSPWPAVARRMHSGPTVSNRAAAVLRHGCSRRSTPLALLLGPPWQQSVGTEASWFGCFRGEEGQEDIGVRVGSHEGTHPTLVSRD